MTIALAFVLSLFLAPQEAERPQRFDYLVRADFFAGVAGTRPD